MTCCQKKHIQYWAFKMMRVEVVCATDDPTDDLMAIQWASHRIKMFPSFRPDKFILIENENFITSVNKLSDVIGSFYRQLHRPHQCTEK